ncbi:hypothetical protein TGP89_356660 [Toxoplasma gondii p89]|uniref:Uncharacterized protein n=3 Tax=Toxoplasma gondii TaxID=5811 RepID=A0A086LDG2_TOXGO|nr:hypothetical protein TGP89_356660 [Toxoplasma gondii p89]KFG54680.1 hypothetical protein TGFOU_356660 [Toxoplasma gondii FOU]RQX69869.1 hypothetical protein TGCAST_356660 [Toxoplasma gondii CAST]
METEKNVRKREEANAFDDRNFKGSLPTILDIYDVTGGEQTPCVDQGEKSFLEEKERLGFALEHGIEGKKRRQTGVHAGELPVDPRAMQRRNQRQEEKRRGGNGCFDGEKQRKTRRREAQKHSLGRGKGERHENIRRRQRRKRVWREKGIEKNRHEKEKPVH